ncbi:hypothetical protein BGZ63DRAFT_436849 [Mariannaea sp. PMI_226]|nr:hypothetical protein BGZ63DRAFT_436849 [Mariannaea sp. PMI_226]
MQQHAHCREWPSYSNRWGFLAGDIAAAAVSASLVAPSVTIIDRALVEKVSTNRSIISALRTHGTSAILNPKALLSSRPFCIIWSLYAATYAVANTSDTLANEFHKAAVGSITFVSTMVVNVPMGVWKDVRFAQIFGANAAMGSSKGVIVQPKVPKSATVTFLLRDAITIFGSFTMAPQLSSAIPDSLSTSAHVKAAITQFTVPIFSQLGATPMHLLGLDLFNRQASLPISNRVAQVGRDLPSATLVRCARIIPAFGFGCVANMETRNFFQKLLQTS